MKKTATISLICLVLVGFITFKLAINKEKINEKKQPVKSQDIRIPVTTTTVTKETLTIDLVKTGILKPFKEAKVFSVNSGNVEQLLFNLGDKVQRGQTLAIINTQLLELDLQKSESNMAKLKRDFQTYTELLEGNAATQENVDNIRQSYNDTQNQVKQLRRKIADATIKSPISGSIVTKGIEEGMFVNTGDEIASIVNLTQLKVQVYLTESEVYKITLGQKVKLKTEVYPDKAFLGTITFINPQINKAFTYQVEITAANEKDAPLRSGTFVNADFSKKTTQEILVIPREALNESTQNASVYVVQEGKAIIRSIKVGSAYGNMIQVTEGLQEGDQIITAGQINLRDGTLINITK